MKIARHFTREGVDPFSTVDWESRDVVIKDSEGGIILDEKNVKAPTTWSDNALRVVVSRYFRGAPGSEVRERGVEDLIKRVVGTIKAWAIDEKYFTPDEASIFYDELCYMCLHQMMAWNSPVWFNLGVEGEAPQTHACFIMSIEDTMLYEPGVKWTDGDQLPYHPTSIAGNVLRESHIFSLGSGVGAAMEGLRSSYETISAGGKASGPVSFMMAYDSWANIIKSGGKTRRAAVMRTLSDWHLDLWHGKWDGADFISCKAYFEHMARHLIANGFSSHMDGAVYKSLPLQNCNISVRASDDFMMAVQQDDEWELRGTKDSSITRTFRAKEIFDGICRGTWECGDPGMQFDDTIQRMHTCMGDGPQRSTNPCSEYLWMDDTACNLASLNLIKFLTPTMRFDFESFEQAVRLTFISQDLFLDRCVFPDRIIREKSLRYRTIGLGFGNLGALLMSLGLAYDSPEGRQVAAAVTALMQACAWRTSNELASELGPCPAYHDNETYIDEVLHRHLEEHELAANGVGPEANVHDVDTFAAGIFSKALVVFGQLHSKVRNAQLTVLAPTGTIGFLMDFSSTSLEPMLALREFKTLSSGGTLLRVPGQIRDALLALGYEEDTEEIAKYIEANGFVTGCPGLMKEHYKVFDCALPSYDDPDKRAISPEGHLRMMAAVQPFLSGGMSKTVNCPESTTPEQIGQMYMWAWEHGIKCLSVFRENSKATSATGTRMRKDTGLRDLPELPNPNAAPVRKHLPDAVPTIRKKIQVGNVEGYLHIGEYEDGTPGEVFVRMSTLGDTVNGFAEAVAVLMSLALQYRIPADTLLRKLERMQFPPNGLTALEDKEFCEMARSIPHYIASYMRHRYEIRNKDIEAISDFVVKQAAEAGEEVRNVRSPSGMRSLTDCPRCGQPMGSLSSTCHQCENCFYTQGTCTP